MNTTYTVSVKHQPTGRVLRLIVLSRNPADAIVSANRALNPADRPLIDCEFIAFGAEVAA